MDRFVDPTIADLQAEYENAFKRGRRCEAAKIWLVGHIALFRALALHGGLTAIEALHDLPGGGRRALIRTVAASSTVALVSTGLLAIAPFAHFVSRGDSRSLELTLYLIPQTLPLTIPVGLTFGVLWGLGGLSASAQTRGVALLLAFGASLMTFTMVAWVAPNSNQAFRVSSAGQPLPKGDRELTLRALRQQLPPLAAGSTDSRRAALSYHARWALAAAPFVLATFAVVFTTRRPWGVMSFVAGCLTILVYCVLIVAARGFGMDGTISPLAAAWVPNTSVLLLALAIMRFSPHRKESGRT